jgi:hypothetical protein
MNSRIVALIRSSVSAAIKQICTEDDSIAAAIMGRETKPNLVLNSSFISRDKRSIPTTQASRRLVAQLASKGRQVLVDDLFVADDTAIRDNYKLIPPSDKFNRSFLDQAINQELEAMGDLIFVLVGKLAGLRQGSEAVGGKAVTELRLDPQLKSRIKRIDQSTYAVGSLVSVEDLLSQVDADLQSEGGFADAERTKVAEAYDRLLDVATADVVISTSRIQQPEETILGRIVDALKFQTGEYRIALQALVNGPDDKHALNEVLRIAYNFSSDVVPLLFLFVSICDLKPLVFWCTVGPQWAFRAALGNLPWLAMGKKEKLEDYRAIISRARDHAFHHILPFDATLEVDLSKFDVRAEKIRLFSPYGARGERGIYLKDQALAELFAEFSRSRQRPVSLVFWQANLRVMETACSLAGDVLHALICIHEVQRASG